MKTFYLVQILILLSLNAICQKWTNYTKKDGLASDTIIDIAVDHTGNIWFSTWGKGVTKYDGSNWIIFDTNSGLLSNYVNAIAVDLQNNKWFGSGYIVDDSGPGLYCVDAGVSKFDNNIWTVFPNLTGEGWFDMVLDIASDSFGNIWCATPHGLVEYNHATWTRYGSDSVSNFVINEDSTIYCKGHGFRKYTGSSSTLMTEHTYGSAALCFDHKGNLWMMETYGLYKYDGSIYEYFNNNEIDYYFNNAIAIDNSDNVWVGTYDSGVYKFDGNNWAHFTTKDGLISNTIKSIAIDTAENIWFGTNEGVSKFETKDTSTTDSRLTIEHTQKELSLFPNPATIIVKIILPIDDHYDIYISKIDGSIVKIINNYFGSDFKMQTSNMESGVYFITAKRLSDNKIYNGKIIITK